MTRRPPADVRHESPSPLNRRARISLAMLTIVAALGGFAFVAIRGAGRTTEDAASRRLPAVLTLVRNGFRYEYQVAIGREGLFEIKDGVCGVVDVLRDHVEEAKACRRALEEKIGVSNLDEVRAASADTVRRLHALGYF